MRELLEQISAYEKKYNPEGTVQGARAAHRMVAEDLKKLIEAKKLDPARISLKTLWEATVEKKDLSENISSSGFPTIAGEIISSVIIAAYQAFPKAGDRLVRTVPSRLKESKIAGWKAIGKISALNERQPYGQVLPPDEKTATIKNQKYGGVLDLTKEAIFFDQTGQLMDDAQ